MNVSGMTCTKCKKLVHERLHKKVSEINNIHIYRPSGKVKIEFNANVDNFEEKMEQIISTINSIVYGKFKASIHSGTHANSNLYFVYIKKSLIL